jgi:hypothetical protein
MIKGKMAKQKYNNFTPMNTVRTLECKQKVVWQISSIKCYNLLYFSKQTNHIGILKMLRPILNYIFECNLQQHGGHYKENGEL